MADQKIEPVGCLGRVLTLIGVAWLGIVVLSGIFGLRGGAGSLGALIGSTLPGLLLIGVGRNLSRRAAERRDAPALPQPSAPPTTPRVDRPAAPSQPSPTPPTEAFPRRARSSPVPAPETEVPSELPPPSPTPAPKSSQEMIEEARKRWGRRPIP